jgi:hypothetical protein
MQLNVAGNHHAIAVSASANPPSSGPMSSNLTGLEPFISSTSSSSDIQPSEIFGVFSAGNCFVLPDSSWADIFARTSWYRSNLASWVGKVVVVVEGTFWGTIAKMSTRWLRGVKLAFGSLFTAGDAPSILESQSRLGDQYFRNAYFDVCVTTFCKASVSLWTSRGSACMIPALCSPKLP